METNEDMTEINTMLWTTRKHYDSCFRIRLKHEYKNKMDWGAFFQHWTSNG